jgi:hypothetical protein
MTENQKPRRSAIQICLFYLAWLSLLLAAMLFLGAVYDSSPAQAFAGLALILNAILWFALARIIALLAEIAAKKSA